MYLLPFNSNISFASKLSNPLPEAWDTVTPVTALSKSILFWAGIVQDVNGMYSCLYDLSIFKFDVPSIDSGL